MSNTRGGIYWKWLEYERLLGKMSLSRSLEKSFGKLAWIYVIVTYKCVIFWRIKSNNYQIYQVNLPEETKYLSIRVCALTVGVMEKMQKVKGQTKTASILHSKWFIFFTNWGIWSGKNYNSYGWPTEFVLDIEIDRL